MHKDEILKHHLYEAQRLIRESYDDLQEYGKGGVMHSLGWDNKVRQLSTVSSGDGIKQELIPKVDTVQGKKSKRTLTPFKQSLEYFEVFLKAMLSSKFTNMSKDQTLKWLERFRSMGSGMATKFDEVGDVFQWMGMIGNVDYNIGSDAWDMDDPKKKNVISKLPKEYQDIRKVSMLSLNVPDNTIEYRKYIPFRAVIMRNYGQAHIHFNVLGKENLGSFKATRDRDWETFLIS